MLVIIIGLLLDLVLIITTGLTEYPGSKPSPIGVQKRPVVR